MGTSDQYAHYVIMMPFIQRPDVGASAALDMYLIRRTAMWLSKFRGGDVIQLADTFGSQLFGELDYVREAENCERFRKLYGLWDDVVVPPACTGLTRKKVIVMEWVEGTKGPWMGPMGIDMVRIGLRCSTDQLLRTGSVQCMHSREGHILALYQHAENVYSNSFVSVTDYSTLILIEATFSERLMVISQ